MVTMPIYALSANHWAMDSVDFAKNNGVITVNRSTLTSTQTITRKEIAYALMKIEKVSYSNNVATGFSDVATGSTYAGAIRWASNQGLITGYTDGTFRPDDPVKRQDCALMIYRYLIWKNIDISTSETDLDYDDASSIQSYARTAVVALHYAGIMSGFDDNTYRPRTNTYMTEAACAFTRAYGYRYNSPNSINIYVKDSSGSATNNAALVFCPYGSANSYYAQYVMSSNGFASLSTSNSHAVNLFGYYTSNCSDDYLSPSPMYVIMRLPANQSDYELPDNYARSRLWPHSNCRETTWAFPDWCPTAMMNGGQNYGWRYLSGVKAHSGQDYYDKYEGINETLTNTTGKNMRVVEVDDDPELGNFVRVQIVGENVFITYQHLSVKKVSSINQIIPPGGEIGITGNTGDSYGDHLHLVVSNIDTKYPSLTQTMDPRVIFE